MKYIALITALALVGCDTHNHDRNYEHVIIGKRNHTIEHGLVVYDVCQRRLGGTCSNWMIVTDQDWQLGDRLTIQAHKPNIEK